MRKRDKNPMQMAQEKCREVRDTLHRRKMFMYPESLRRPGQVPAWEASFGGLYADGILSGEWRLHGRWRYWSDPSSGRPSLQESSVGVTVITHGRLELPEPACIARYDVELHGGRRGRHLNIFQPVLKDSVHWLVFDDATRFDDWSFDQVLSFLITDLPNELLNAGWPKQ